MSSLQQSKILLTAAILFGFTASPGLAQIFNAAADFSITNNPNGAWRYGWSSTLGSEFNFYDQAADLCPGTIESWNAPFSLGNPRVMHNSSNSTVNCITITFQPNELAFHPGPSGQYSIIRWLAPEAGIYSLETTFKGVDFSGPTTTDVHVLHNGTSLFDDLIDGFGDPSATSFDAMLSVQAGDTIDFAVGFGSNNSFAFDSTGIDAIFSKKEDVRVSEPSLLLALLALGIVGIGWLPFRKQC